MSDELPIRDEVLGHSEHWGKLDPLRCPMYDISFLDYDVQPPTYELRRCNGYVFVTTEGEAQLFSADEDNDTWPAVERWSIKCDGGHTLLQFNDEGNGNIPPFRIEWLTAAMTANLLSFVASLPERGTDA